MTPSFWRGKRVFLTGHTGFKGSWLAVWLSRLGADVTGYALNPPSQPNLFELTGMGDAMEDIRADIRDLDRLTSAVAQARPDILIHMAAQALVRPSYDDPVGTYATNVMGTVNVLEAVRQTGNVRAVLIVTTDKCYENREWHWGYRENEPMGGRDPYSNSKGCAELVTASWRDSFFPAARFAEHGTAIASARAGNVIGGGDWALDRLVPDIIAALTEGERPLIRYPDAIRPWQYVLEPLSGYLMLCESLYRDGTAFTGGWNFGPDDRDAQPVRWVADRLCSLWGGGAGWHTDKRVQPHEATYLKLDCSKARALLGWQPAWRLDDALENLVEWYRGHYAGKDARGLMLAQIKRYEEAMGVQV